MRNDALEVDILETRYSRISICLRIPPDVFSCRRGSYLFYHSRFERKLSTVKNSLDQHRLTKIIPTVLTIALLTLPAVLSHAVVPVSASTNTSTEQLVTDYSAAYIGQVVVSSLPAPSVSDVIDLGLPDLSLSEQAQTVATDPVAVVSPGSQQFIHMV